VSSTPWERPDPQSVWRAIETYLRLAYPPPGGGASGSAPGPAPAAPSPPAAVRSRLETLRSTPEEAFYDCPVFERTGADSGDPYPSRYSLRLGNRAYPHMKLVIDRAPCGRSYLLRADTHDAHCQPRPGSPEQAAFAQLSRHNRELADAIEAAWEADHLPTFKKFLRDDLARRKCGVEQGQARQ
jgi:hypothetical protein